MLRAVVREGADEAVIRVISRVEDSERAGAEGKLIEAAIPPVLDGAELVGEEIKGVVVDVRVRLAHTRDVELDESVVGADGDAPIRPGEGGRERLGANGAGAGGEQADPDESSKVVETLDDEFDALDKSEDVYPLITKYIRAHPEQFAAD